MIRKFEYKAFNFKGGDHVSSKETLDELNLLGDKGWSLASQLWINDQPGDEKHRWSGVFTREILPTGMY